MVLRSTVSFVSRHCVNGSKLSLSRNVQTVFMLHCESQFSQYRTDNQRSTDQIYQLDGSVNQDFGSWNGMLRWLSCEGRMGEARHLFDQLPDPDLIAWTAVISGYAKCGMMKEARKLFDQVDAKKDVVTWTAMVRGYLQTNLFSEAEKFFNEMPEKNVFSWNTMIDGYFKQRRINEALRLFKKMPLRNVVSWNMIITGLAKCGRIEEAWCYFDRMPERNVISWTAIVAGLSKAGRVDEARALFEGMTERNIVTWNAMISGYTRNLRLDEAFALFERMPNKNISSWNTLITGFIQCGDLTKARKFFNEMPQKDVISWSTMISAYVHKGQREEALMIFLEMYAGNVVKPNEAIFVSILSACSGLTGLGEGKQIHQMINKTAYQDNAFVVSALVNMYTKCGDILTARRIFDDGLKGQGDLVAWNGMIAAYGHHGFGREAIKLFEEMQNLGLKPNDVTYVGLLAACSHAGLVDEGLTYFGKLASDNSLQLRESHYTCLIDICGRAGKLKEAFHLIERLPSKPSVKVWGALLAGCNVHGNANLGKRVEEKLSQLEPENTGTYMLLANIYASTGKWKEAANLRLKMKGKGLKKQPGCSWIEVGNRIHVFVVGDKSHLEGKHIYSLLHNLHAKMKKISFILAHDYLSEDNIQVT